MGLEITEVVSNVQETNITKIMRIKLAAASPLANYKPGQFINIYLRQENTDANNVSNYIYARPYSLLSSPTEKSYVEISYKVSGQFTQRLAMLKPGDEIGIKGPFGTFTFDEKDTSIVMLAAGIGIVPFISTLRFATEKKLSNKFMLFYSNKVRATIAFFGELEKLRQKNKNMVVINTVTQEESSGLEHGRISEQMFRKYLLPEQFKSSTFYVCGGHDFVDSMLVLLAGLGIDSKHIRKEDFGKV